MWTLGHLVEKRTLMARCQAAAGLAAALVADPDQFHLMVKLAEEATHALVTLLHTLLPTKRKRTRKITTSLNPTLKPISTHAHTISTSTAWEAADTMILIPHVKPTVLHPRVATRTNTAISSPEDVPTHPSCHTRSTTPTHMPPNTTLTPWVLPLTESPD